MTGLADIPEAASIAARFDVPAPIHANDFMYIYQLGPDPGKWAETRPRATEYYFSDGARSAARLDELIAQLHPGHSRRTLRLLEFASGYGMVSRHLGRMKDRYALTACDIHEQAIAFLRTEIGVEAILSRTDPDDVTFPGTFDAIFALSFFSHVPDRTWGRWLRRLYGALAEGGLLIFTTHGRGGHDRAGRPPLTRDGYWFAASSEQADLQPEDYGTILVEPCYVFQHIERCEDAALVLFAEAFWWADQDIYVIRKTPGSSRRRLSPAREDNTDTGRVVALMAENRMLRESIDIIRASHSWRVTAPMRGLSHFLRGGGRGPKGDVRGDAPD
jgi:SAM-dependent methyltransferase